MLGELLDALCKTWATQMPVESIWRDYDKLVLLDKAMRIMKAQGDLPSSFVRQFYNRIYLRGIWDEITVD